MLETRGAKFNMFGALGLTHKERAHSDMLGWLCDPIQTHGLGDSFARLLVRYVTGGRARGWSGSLDVKTGDPHDYWTPSSRAFLSRQSGITQSRSA